MSDLPERLRELSDVLIGCEWDVPLCAAEDCVRAADEIERLQSLLEPCRHDSDTQTDSGYPCTTNDYLSLLSAYIADYMPEECIPGDEYFAAWERAARPVIERLTAELSEKTGELETCRKLLREAGDSIAVGELTDWPHWIWCQGWLERADEAAGGE